MTEPTDQHTCTIRLELPAVDVDEFERRAATMHLSAEEYVLCVLAEHTCRAVPVMQPG